MLLSCIEIRRVCVQTEANRDDGEAHFFVSLVAPYGIELSNNAAQFCKSEVKGDDDKELAVRCAIDTDLQGVFFAVRQMLTMHVELDTQDLTLQCRVWYMTDVREEGHSGNEGTSDSTSNKLLSFSSSASYESDLAMLKCQLLAEGTVRTMQYGLQTVELVKNNISAEGHVKDSILITFFVSPRLMCTVEEKPRVRVVEETDFYLPRRLEASENCDCLIKVNASFALNVANVEDDVLEPTLESHVSSENAAEVVALVTAAVTTDDDDDDCSVTGETNLIRQGSVVDVGRLDRTGVVSFPTSRENDMAATRWMFFVELAPWQGTTPTWGKDLENMSPCYIKDDPYVEAEGLWRLTLCGADGHILARGSSFRESVCCRSGWSDAMMTLNDTIIATSLVSLQLQELMPAEHIVDEGDNRNVTSSCATLKHSVSEVNRPVRWRPVAMSNLLPVSDLLVSSTHAHMHSVSLFAVGGDDMSLAPRVPFAYRGRLVKAFAMLSRAPAKVGALDETAWMTAQYRSAALLYNEVMLTQGCHLPRGDPELKHTTILCSVALHVCTAVIFRPGSHVDKGVVYPLVALSVSGGCELLLETASERGNDDGDDDGELRRAPVVRFDARIHTTVDETHPILLLTLHSMATQDVVFCRAVFSPFELSLLPIGRVWLPLYNDKVTTTTSTTTIGGDDDDSHDHGGNESEHDLDVAGWIHCSYECVFVLERCETSAGSPASFKLLQRPLSLHTPPLMSECLVTPLITRALQWNCLRLSVVEAVNVYKSSTSSDTHKHKCGVCANVHVVPPPTYASYVGTVKPVSAFTTPVVVSVSPRWKFTGTLVITADTTHLCIQIFGYYDLKRKGTECLGVIDIPRVANSRFWTTSTGEVWLPIVAPRRSSSRYCGAILLRWSFNSGVHPNGGIPWGINVSSRPQWSVSVQTQPPSVSWVRLSNIELVWPWLLHHTAWKSPFTLPLRGSSKIFLRLIAGNVTYELPLEPSFAGSGHCLFVGETVCLPLTDSLDVAVCYYCSHSFPFSYLSIPYFLEKEILTTSVATIGVGKLLLSTNDRVDLVTRQGERHMVIQIESPAMPAYYRVQPGLLTAKLVTAQIEQPIQGYRHRHRHHHQHHYYYESQRRGTRWTWPPSSCSTVIELRLGRVIMQNEQSFFFYSVGQELPDSRWTVSVRQKGTNENVSNAQNTTSNFYTDIVYPPVVLKTTAASPVTPREDGDALFLFWPAPRFVHSLHHRPPPPIVELLFSKVKVGAPIGDVSVTPECVGFVILDLPYCFEGLKGTKLFPLLHTFASREGTYADKSGCGSSNILGIVELHYVHNLVEEGVDADSDDDVGKNAEKTDQRGEGSETKNLLLITVVKARYRRRGQLFSSPKGEGPLTSFVVGVDKMSWRTTTQVGMTPQFDCQMVFAHPYTTEEHVGKTPNEALDVRLQMLPEVTLNNCGPFVDETVSQPPAVAFALLHLERCDFAPVGEVNSGQWVPLYMADAEMGDICVLVGEVLLRWGWFSDFLWDRFTPLSVSTAPPPSPETGDGDKITTVLPAKVKGESALPPFFLYLLLHIYDFLAFSGPLFETTQETETEEFVVTVYMEENTSLAEPSFVSLVSYHQQEEQSYQRLGGCGAKYGDYTGAAPFNSVSKRCTWMEYCFLPMPTGKEMSLYFEVRCPRGCNGSDVLGFGRLRDCEFIVGGGVSAVPIFYADETQPCGTLRVAVALSPLYRERMAVSTSDQKLQECTTDSLEAVGNPDRYEGDKVGNVQCLSASVAVDVPQLALFWCTVHKVELYGQSVLPSEGCWDLMLRTEVMLAERVTHQWTRLEVGSSVDGHSEEWGCAVCAQNMSKMEVWLRHTMTGISQTLLEGLRKVYGQFVVSCVPPTDGGLGDFFQVDLLRHVSSGMLDNTYIPVGRLCMSCRPLLQSGVLYDPYSVFFRRSLRLTVTELLGVVRAARCRRWHHYPRSPRFRWGLEGGTVKNNGSISYTKKGKGDEKECVLCREKAEEALVYMRLQCQTETAVSLPFAPPVVRLPKERSSQVREKNSGNNIKDNNGDDVLHFSLLLDCCPVDSDGGAEVRLSLHFSPLCAETKEEGGVHASCEELLIGEAVTHVPPVGHEVNLDSTASKDDVAVRWVPISTVGRELSRRTAYAQLRYAWSHKVILGSWLMCVRIRPANRHLTLHSPFLCFVVRFPTGEVFSLPLDLFDIALSEPSAKCPFAAVAAPLQSVWSFAHIQLPLIWPLGAKVECVELHDRVAAGITIHLGTYRWTVSDTPLLVSFEGGEREGGSQNTAGLFASTSFLSPFLRGRWLRFKSVDGEGTQGKDEKNNALGCTHEVLLVRSPPPPRGAGATKDLHVPFFWWPVKAVLYLSIPGLDLTSLEAGRLVVSCSLCLGRWKSTATTAATSTKTSKPGWVWEDHDEGDGFLGNAKTDAMLASNIVLEPSSATVTATWGVTTAAAMALGGGGVFKRYICVGKLRDGAARYALRAKIVCQTRYAPPSFPELSREAVATAGNFTLCTREAIFVLDDCCIDTRGETLLKFTESKDLTAAVNPTTSSESTREDSIILAWAIEHDKMMLSAPNRDCCCPTVLNGLFLDGNGEEKGGWRRYGKEGVPQESVLPSWLVTSIEVKDLPVVLDVSMVSTTTTAARGHVQPNIPVLAHLVEQTRQRRIKSFSSWTRKDKNTTGFPLISVNATPATKLRQRPFYALHMEPMWYIKPRQWMDHKRSLHLTLWQVLSSTARLRYTLGTLRLEAILRDAFVELSMGSWGGAGDTFEEVVTDWINLCHGEVMAQDMGSVRFRLRPIIEFPTNKRLDDRQMYVCVKVMRITAHLVGGGGTGRLDGCGDLALVFCPAGNSNFMSCSTTRLQRMTEAALTTGPEGNNEYDATDTVVRDKIGNSRDDGKHDNAGAGGGVSSYSLLALSTFHSLLLDGRRLGVDADGDAWLGIDVLLVGCSEGNSENHGNLGVDRGDVACVLSTEHLDLGCLWRSFKSQGDTRDESRPSLYNAADFTVTLCFFSNVITLCLHVVPLQLNELSAAELDENTNVSSTLSRLSQFFCSSDGHGEDNSNKNSFGGVLCTVGDKVYRILGTEVYEWDAQELQRICSSSFAAGAVAFSIPRLSCFKWRTVNTKRGVATHVVLPPCRFSGQGCPRLRLCPRRRVGHTVWTSDGKHIMLDGGLCLAPNIQEEATPPRPPSGKFGRKNVLKRTRRRGKFFANDTFGNGEVQFVNNTSFALSCYDTSQHSWGVVHTGGDDTTMSSLRVFHSAVVVNEKVWCFGGFYMTENLYRDEGWDVFQGVKAIPLVLLNTLTCLDLSTRQWIMVEPLTQMNSRATCQDCSAVPFAAVKTPLMSSPPPPVACHTAVGWNGQMFVFGGLRELPQNSGVLAPSDALYVFHASRLTWWLLSPLSAADSSVGGGGDGRGTNDGCRNWPSARYGHAAAVVPEHPHGAFIIFGGATGFPKSGRAEGATVLCALDELLWIYYTALGYWQNIHAPLHVPLTRRVFSSMQVMKLTGEPWASYTVVVTGGCDRVVLEQYLHNSKKEIRELSLVDVQNDLSDEACLSVLPRDEAMRCVLFTALNAPLMGTVWISLEERVQRHVI